MGEEMHLYQTPYQCFGRLDMELWRALRLVAVTGIHWKGWSRREDMKFKLTFSPKGPPAMLLNSH